MEKKLQLRTPGINLALVLNNMLLAKTSFQGFLMGNTSEHVVHTVSDAGEKTEILLTVEILSFVISNPSFFNPSGEINEQALKNTTRGHPGKIVGWFSFRHTSPLIPSLREQAVHRNLEKLVKSHAPLLFGLFGSSSLRPLPTHTHDFRFFTRQNSKFDSVPLLLESFGHKAQTEYSEFSALSDLPQWDQSEHLQLVAHAAVPSQISPLEGYLSSLHDKLQDVVNEVIGSEESISIQTARIAALRQKLSEKQAQKSGDFIYSEERREQSRLGKLKEQQAMLEGNGQQSKTVQINGGDSPDNNNNNVEKTNNNNNNNEEVSGGGGGGGGERRVEPLSRQSSDGFDSNTFQGGSEGTSM